MANKLTSLFGTQDMTVGSPINNIIRFSIPLLIGNVAQQLYSTVDAIIVGKYVGDDALAAVGASNPIIFLLLGLFMGISGGAGIIVSQFFGAKQKERLSKTVGTTLTLTLFVSIFITFLGVFVSKPILSLLGTPTEIFQMTADYLIIVFAGFIGAAFYNIISGILRGMGDSVMPLIFLLVACFLNIGLDLLFVAAFEWGVAGAAIATIISQIISAILCIIRLMKMNDVLIINKQMFIPEMKLVKHIVRIGLPSGITQMIFSTAGLIVQSLTNSFGTTFIAVSTVVMRVDGFAIMPAFTFGIAMTTFAGQNIGAGKMDRVIKGTKSGMIVSCITSAVIVGCILIFGGVLMGMFTNTPEVIDMGTRMLWLLSFGYFGMSITQVLSGVMRGAGDTVTPMWVSILTTVVLRVPIAYGMAFLTRSAEYPLGRPESIYVSLLSAWVFGAVITAIAYKIGRWKKKSLIMSGKHSILEETELPAELELES